MTHGPHAGRRDRAKPLADPTRAGDGGPRVRRMGRLAPVLAVLMALGPVAVSADTVPGTYRAPIRADGLRGYVTVIVYPSSLPAGGYLKWSLTGLQPGQRLVIRVKDGTCRDRGDLIVRYSRTVAGSTSTDRVAIPGQAVEAFVDNLYNGDRGIATVRSGTRHDCGPFHWVGCGDCPWGAAAAAASNGEPSRRT
jgi:hypothetical protein